MTLHIGDKTGTASAQAGVIKVGDKSYNMRLAKSGTLTITIDNVQEAVELSVDTVNIIPDYSLNPQIQYPSTIYPSSNQNYGQYKLYLRYDVTAPYIQGYGNGAFGPKNTLSRAEAAVMLARLTNFDAQIVYPSCNVGDVQSGAWYANVANAFYAAGIEESGSFRPNAPITRGELAVWLYRLSGSPVVNNNAIAFPDAYGSTELARAVAYGRMQGWINGYPDGTYRPNNSLIRAEATKLLNHITNRSLQVKRMTASFKDVPYSYWAYHEIMSAANYV